MGLGRRLPVWAVASFCGAFFVPIINGSNQAIWQAKVAPDVQGRVFSIRRLIAWFVNPAAMLIAGPLADFVLEPAMQPNGVLSNRFGWLVGTGPGAGMALIFIFTGLVAMGVGLGGYLVPVVREAEAILPDHDAARDAPEDIRGQLQALLEKRQQLIKEPRSPERDSALRDISGRLRDLGRQRA